MKYVKLHGIRKGGGCTCVRGRRCARAGKHPHGIDWAKNATDDWTEVSEWTRNGYNTGILLGPRSGIIDVEVDGHTDVNMDGLNTPTYLSSRGAHYLFKYDERLPKRNIVKTRGLEFRLGADGGDVQSVAPPSKHRTNKHYVWTIHPGELDFAPLPDHLLEVLRENRQPEPTETVINDRPSDDFYASPYIYNSGIIRGDSRVVAVRDAVLFWKKKIKRARDVIILRNELQILNATKLRPCLKPEEVEEIIEKNLS